MEVIYIDKSSKGIVMKTACRIMLHHLHTGVGGKFPIVVYKESMGEWKHSV